MKIIKTQLTLVPSENDSVLPSPSQKKLKQKFTEKNSDCGQDLIKKLHVLADGVEFTVSTILGLAS